MRIICIELTRTDALIVLRVMRLEEVEGCRDFRCTHLYTKRMKGATTRQRAGGRKIITNKET